MTPHTTAKDSAAAAATASTAASTAAVWSAAAPAANTAQPLLSAVGSTRAGWRRRLPRTLIYMILMCSAIALLLSGIYGHFKSMLVYSFLIGFICWITTEALRLLMAVVVDWRRGDRPLEQPYQLGQRTNLVLSIAGIVIGPSLGLYGGDLLTGHRTPSPFEVGSPITHITLTITVLATLVSIIILTTQERLAQARADAAQAQRRAAEFQLKLLQSQLEPHMLFNTLANLRVLISMDAPRAQLMLDHLVAFLRSTLTASRQDFHPLATEFERLQDYLALMTVRMGPRLRVSVDLPPELRALPVPPLLLQPLVENAIRHGLEPQVAGGHIQLSASREGASLVLRVRDDGAGLSGAHTLGAAASDVSPNTHGSGFGLTQVRERLTTLYGTAAQLTIHPAPGTDNGTWAQIVLPCTPEQQLAQPPQPFTQKE